MLFAVLFVFSVKLTVKNINKDPTRIPLQPRSPKPLYRYPLPLRAKSPLPPLPSSLSEHQHARLWRRLQSQTHNTTVLHSITHHVPLRMPIRQNPEHHVPPSMGLPQTSSLPGAVGGCELTSLPVPETQVNLVSR